MHSRGTLLVDLVSYLIMAAFRRRLGCLQFALIVIIKLP